jgi:hypothetical protein
MLHFALASTRQMDYWVAIKELYVEKQRLDRAIATLEALAEGELAKAVSRRGRKMMPVDERKKVSERMKRYWESRRNRSTTEKP